MFSAVNARDEKAHVNDGSSVLLKLRLDLIQRKIKLFDKAGTVRPKQLECEA